MGRAVSDASAEVRHRWLNLFVACAVFSPEPSMHFSRENVFCVSARMKLRGREQDTSHLCESVLVEFVFRLNYKIKTILVPSSGKKGERGKETFLLGLRLAELEVAIPPPPFFT
jgi:hypothetical protein